MTEAEDIKRCGIVGSLAAEQRDMNIHCSRLLKFMDPDVAAAMYRVGKAGFRRGMSLGFRIGMIVGGMIVITVYHTYFLFAR